ncbi:MAG TPA: YbdK family carboxylate-amine ligase [Solirubrobacterales bacterium]|nr:YbdK family carboxylate-amine ligase [Solirubrobacterales bacterium]
MSAATDIAAAFDRAEPLSVGVEEELMLLRPGDRALVPEADRVLELLGGDPRFKQELPASQIESLTTPCGDIGELAEQLSSARRDLAAKVGGVVELAAAGVHPLAPPAGELNSAPRYDAAAEYYGPAVLQRQLVCALQVHVAPGSAESALAVYNALRSYLPVIAAIAANAPFYDGRDTGCASIRPHISSLLPRQGVPPALADWEEFAAGLAWGKAGGAMPDAGSWWWELRPHVKFGTLELRVPDAQTTVADAAAIAAFVQSLVGWLSERHARGETLPVHPSWRIAENRWLAARDGVEARLLDLDTGHRRPLREDAGRLLAELHPVAEGLGCADRFGAIEALVQRNGAIRQREVAAERGLEGLVRWLSEEFLAASP